MTEPRLFFQRRNTVRWLTLFAPLILLGMLVGTLALWDGMLKREQKQQVQELDTLAHSLAARLDARLQERMNAIARMAKRWEIAGGTPRHIWEADAGEYVGNLQGLLAMQWLDAAGTVRWVVPLAGNAGLVGTTPNRDPVRLRALDDARVHGTTVLSPPIELIQGGTGVLMFHPVFVQGRFNGFLVSVSRLDALTRGLLPSGTTGQSFALQYEGKVVYTTGPAGGSPDRAATVGAVRLAAGDRRWTLVTAAHAADREQIPLSLFVLGAGLGGTLLIAAMFWFWRAAMLRAAESSQLAQIVAHTTNAVILTDAPGRVEWVNEGFTRITGYSLEEVRGRTPGEILQGPDTDPATVARMRASLARGEGFREQILNYRRDGAPCWLEIEVQPIRDEGGELTGFMAIESDITARKQAEQALREAQNFLSTIIDSMPVTLFVKEASALKYVMFNRASEALLGISRDELLGKSDYDLFPKEQADFFVGRDREVLARGQRLEMLEEPIDTPQGTRLLHTIKVPVNDSQGRAAYLLGISTDITESRKVERLKSEFISTVSHELRTPLTSIRGSLGLVSAGAAGPLTENAKELLNIALKNCERLTDLINDILDVEKIESGKMKFSLETQALAPLMRQAVEANQAYAVALDVSIRLAPVHESVQVSVDPGRFLQVMSNLLSNAAKFSPKGGAVEVAAVVVGNEVRISVADRGPGIPAEFHARIFQRFSQADSSDTRSQGGTGLGLAITKSLVERMGGRIDFNTRAGEGTTFYVGLPLAA
jgi:PAS domain S-box-containing protein